MEDANQLHKSGSKVDVAHLRRMTSDDESLMSEVLEIFREQGSLWERLLSPDNSTPDWMVGAHTIKGSARGIGAWELGEICGAAEEAAMANSLTRDEKFMWREQITQALSEALDEVSKIEYQLKLNSLKSKS